MAIKKHMTLSDQGSISAYLHRSRMWILELLRDRPATASQLAARMGVHPANLTRHLRILVDAGLVELHETRDTGRNLEKYYRVLADSFDVAPEAAHLEAPHKLAIVFARSDLSAAIARLPDELELPVLARLVAARIRRSDLPVFMGRLEKLAAEFEAGDAEEGDAYHLNLALYPGEFPADEEQRIMISRSGER